MSDDPIIQGTLMLSAASLVNKILGAIYRIPLSRVVGDEGIGLYQMASPICAIIAILSTFGIPLATSKLIAEKIAKSDGRGALRIFRLSLFFLLITGTSGSLFLYFSAKFLSCKVLKEPRTYYAIISMAPGLLIMTIDSAFHSLFRGMKQMAPSALSGIIEEITRIITMMLLGYTFMARGIEYAAAGIALGTLSSGIAGIISMAWIYKRKKTEILNMKSTTTLEPITGIFKQLLKLAIPLMLGGLIGPLGRSVETTLIPICLRKAGMDPTEIVKAYGQLIGMAMPLIYLPTIITGSFAVNLIPSVAGDMAISAQYRVRRRARQALRLNALLGLPVSAVLFFLSNELCHTLFANPLAGTLLKFLAPGSFFVGLIQVTSGLLNGLGDTISTTRNRLFSAILKLLSIYILSAHLNLGIKGVALSYTLSLVSLSFFNLIRLSKHVGPIWNLFSILVKPIFGTLCVSSFLRPSYIWFYNLFRHSLPSLISCTVIFSFIYLVTLLAIQGIQRTDIMLIPRFGPKIVGFLEGFGIFG